MSVRSRTWGPCLWALVATQVLRVDPAYGQTVDAETSTIDRARRSGHEALDAFRAGDFERARELFTEAENLTHSPVFLLYRARSEARLSHYADARRDYGRIVDETLESSAPVAWHDAQRDAARERTQLDPYVTVVRVLVRGEFTPPLRLRSDTLIRELDERLVSFEMDVSSFESPRSFVLEDASGRTSSFATRPEAPGSSEPKMASRTLFFEFWEHASSVASSLPRRPSWDEPSPRVAETSESTWPVWTAFGMGAAGLVVAGVTGTLAVTRAAEVKAGCLGTSCRLEDRDLALEAERLGRIATVGTVVAATGAVLGVSLLLWNANETRVTARVTPSSVALNGRF